MNGMKNRATSESAPPNTTPSTLKLARPHTAGKNATQIKTSETPSIGAAPSCSLNSTMDFLMSSIKSLTLTSPIPFNGQMVAELTFREPRMKEYAAHGEPSVVTRTSDGGLVFIENTDAIFAYARDLVTPTHVGVIEYLSLRDTLAVKEKILDFFADARAAGATLVPDSLSPTSTGSEPATSPD